MGLLPPEPEMKNGDKVRLCRTRPTNLFENAHNTNLHMITVKSADHGTGVLH